jgi:hypothetical protein
MSSPFFQFPSTRSFSHRKVEVWKPCFFRSVIAALCSGEGRHEKTVDHVTEYEVRSETGEVGLFREPDDGFCLRRITWDTPRRHCEITIVSDDDPPQKRDSVMRVIATAILCLFTIALTALSSYGDPKTRARIYFAAPAGDDSNDVLLGSFKRGLNVTLLNEKEICKAKTGSAVLIDHMGGKVKATSVVGSGKCPKDITIAVAGSAAKSVQLHLPEKIQTPLPADMKLKVHRYMKRTLSFWQGYEFASPDPQAFKVGRFTFLKFRWKGTFIDGIDEIGPCVLCFEDQFVEFTKCTIGHVFFSVNEVLYFAFHHISCSSGANSYEVYDLSGASPKRVYYNDELSS